MLRKIISIHQIIIDLLIITCLYPLVILQAETRQTMSIQNPDKRMVMITPQILQHPEQYKIHLCQTVNLSHPVFMLYSLTGVKVIEKPLDIKPPIRTIDFDEIIPNSDHLAAGYYFYEIQPNKKSHSSLLSDSVPFINRSC